MGTTTASIIATTHQQDVTSTETLSIPDKSTTPLPEKPSSDPLPEPESPEPLEEPLNAANKMLVFFVVFILAFLVVISPNPWQTVLFLILSLVPSYPFFRYIRYAFPDPAVSRSFLASQLLLAAVPGFLIVANIQTLITALVGFLVFNSNYEAVTLALDDIDSSSLSSDDYNNAILEALSKIVPLWKILVFFCLIAFLASGPIEEFAKWAVARRYKQIVPNEPADDSVVPSRIGVRGILASFCIPAIGFAMSENIFFMLGVANARRDSFSWSTAASVLGRGILAYPLHVGAQFLIGVASAQRDVLGDQVSVWAAVFTAIIIHSMFDLVGFIVLVLVAADKVGNWLGALVPAVDLIVVLFLGILCWSRHRSLVQREKMLAPVQQV